MKAKQFIFKGMLLAATSALLVTSCKKEKEEDPADNDTSVANDNSLAEGSFNDVSNISDEASEGSLSSYKMEGTDGILSGCAIITRDSINHSDPDSITIDFGTVNCLGLDNRNRRGKILIIYSGHYRDSASTHTTTFDNYYVNDNKIYGSKTVTNKGHNSAGNLNWDITVAGNIDLANGGTITWNSTRNREMTAGESTPLIRSDDKYSITGSASGTSAKGTSYTMTITGALIRDMSCKKHFVQGTYDLVPSGKATRTVDFGTGSCDNVATVTIKGKTYTITLK
jgi:hypothetical protein